jgi:hypothetical protein
MYFSDSTYVGWLTLSIGVAVRFLFSAPKCRYSSFTTLLKVKAKRVPFLFVLQSLSVPRFWQQRISNNAFRLIHFKYAPALQQYKAMHFSEAYMLIAVSIASPPFKNRTSLYAQQVETNSYLVGVENFFPPILE